MNTFFLVDKSCPEALSLMKKIAERRPLHGAIIEVTEKEMAAWRDGKMQCIDIESRPSFVE